MSFARFAIVATISVATVAACGVSSKSEPALSATELLNRTTAVYANAESYRDRGTVSVNEPLALTLLKSVFNRPRNEFTTSFARRSATAELTFRSGAGRTFSVASTASGISIRGIDELAAQPATLAAAAEVLRPVTASASAAVLPMLVRAPGATSLRNPTFLADDEVEGEQCFRVRGVTSANVTQTLSIEKRRFVIRRIRQVLPLRSGETERTIDYTSVDIRR